MKYLCIILIVLISSCNEQSQTLPQPSTQASDSLEDSVKDTSPTKPISIRTISSIKEAYAATEAIRSQLDTIAFNFNCHDERQGRIKYYFHNKDLKIIEHVYYEMSHYESTHMYYLNEDAPYFMFYKNTYWTFDGQQKGEPQTKDTVTEKRYYVVDDALVQCLEKSYTIRSGVNDNPKPDTIANKEVDCPAFASIQKDFNSLYKHRNNKEDLECLE